MSDIKGKIIINTSAQSKAEKINTLLKNKGAKVLNFPLITIQPNNNNAKTIEQTLSALYDFSWVVFTSTNGVKYFHFWVQKFNINTENISCNFAAIGSATATALVNLGYSVKFISSSKDSQQYAHELLHAFVGENHKILVPTGNLASPHLQHILNTEQLCKYLVVYNTVENNDKQKELSAIINQKKYDLVLFLSPSAVKSFVSQNKLTNLAEVKAVALGKTTAAAMLKYGIVPLLTASTPNIQTLINEIAII